MVVGFNHNLAYNGAIYHVQTEDHGPKSPSIVTLLYRDGTILASRRVSYADIVRIDNLEQVVAELMKELHREVLHALNSGAFDEVIARFERPAAAAPAAMPAATASDGLERMVLCYLTGEEA